MPSHSEGPGIWLSVWRFLLTRCLYERAAEVLERLHGCAGSPEPSLLALAISTKFAWRGPNDNFEDSYPLSIQDVKTKCVHLNVLRCFVHPHPSWYPFKSRYPFFWSYLLLVFKQCTCKYIKLGTYAIFLLHFHLLPIYYSVVLSVFYSFYI